MSSLYPGQQYKIRLFTDLSALCQSDRREGERIGQKTQRDEKSIGVCSFFFCHRQHSLLFLLCSGFFTSLTIRFDWLLCYPQCVCNLSARNCLYVWSTFIREKKKCTESHNTTANNNGKNTSFN